jgi:hypothetical protein
MENYHSMPHTNKDLSNLMISWFLEGKCSLSHVFVLNTSNFWGKKKICRIHLDATIVNLVRA